MSFANDLETATSSRYEDFPEFEGISQTIENILYNINNNQLVSLKKLLVQYEYEVSNEPTGDKSRKLSARISSLTSKTTSSFKNINQNATKLNQYLSASEQNHEDEETLSYLRQKEAILINLVKTSVGQFQRQQKQFEQLEQSATKHKNELLLSEDSSPQAQTSETQVQNQVQITYEPVNAEELEEQTLLIQEREREIHQISQDISEINDIFSNLHELVSEQQETLDSIEDNILHYADDARGATTELRRAERYQRRSSGRMACCLAILLGVFGMVIFIGVVF
ncbi:syntaxin Pep12p [[Candida] anglica]|uniref:Syntaxin Pep12p n=1 Tax=[Candida] anglica TaxID=148631 RepID=A0ABP0E6Q9_9ASCO